MRGFAVTLFCLSLISVFVWNRSCPQVSDSRTTLIWVTDDNSARREHVEQFNRLHPELNLQLDPDNAGLEKIIVQSLGGVGPDLFDCYSLSGLDSFVRAGVAWDLTDVLKNAGINVERDCWPALRPNVTINGRVYGFPSNVAVDVLYLNKAAFDEAGEPLPRGSLSWSEFLPIAQRMVKRDSRGRIIRFGIAFDDSKDVEQSFWKTLLLQWGGSVFSEDGRSCTLDQPQAIAAVQFLHDLIYRYRVAPSPAELSAMSMEGGWGAGAMRLLTSGRSACTTGGRWWLISLRHQEGLQLGACEVPHNPGNNAFYVYGKATLINRNSPHRDLALKLLEYMASFPYSNLLNQQADGLAPIRAFCTNDVLVNPRFPSEAEFQPLFPQVMPMGKIVPPSPFVNSTLAMRLINEQLDLVRQDLKSPADAMRAAKAHVDDAIADALRRDPELQRCYHELTGRERP